MTKQVVSAIVLFAESLIHVSTIVENVEAVSPWMVGACGIGVVMASAVILHAVHEVLPINGPLQIEEWDSGNQSSRERRGGYSG
jgi:hypothetical protein